MTRRPVGYYVHHQGAGHLARARMIAPLLDRPVTLIGTFDDSIGDPIIPRLDLPDDRLAGFDGDDRERQRPQAFHYSPVGVAAIRERMARIAAWVAANDPVMVIVDVSAEVALLARLLSVPTIVVRLAGRRTDQPHLEAFRAAERLLAPFPAGLEDDSTPTWVREKTIHAGFLADPAPAVDAAPPDDRRPLIAVLFGRGGDGGDVSALGAAARAVPDADWEVLGPVGGSPKDLPPNLALRGWVYDVGPSLACASLVIGTGGDGVIAAVAACGKPFICIPEPRPFDEQRAKAEALDRLGAAIHQDGWHGPIDWPVLIRRGLDLDPRRMAALVSPDALVRTATVLNEIADDLDRRPDRPGTDLRRRSQNGRSGGRRAASMSSAVGVRRTW